MLMLVLKEGKQIRHGALPRSLLLLLCSSNTENANSHPTQKNPHFILTPSTKYFILERRKTLLRKFRQLLLAAESRKQINY